MSNSAETASGAAGEKAEYTGQPKRRCDIVMKGDITSGVVYPKVVSELAKSYRFMSIGGTSSGAMAAAAAAAAELRRFNKGDQWGFDKLERLPGELGLIPYGEKKSMLAALFQPQDITKPLFDVALSSLDDKVPLMSRIFKRVLPAAIGGFPLAALLGLIPGVVLLLVLITGSTHSWVSWLGYLIAAVVAGVGALLVLVYAFVRRLFSGLNSNYFGFCTGMPAASGKGKAALTTWLADYLDLLAGVSDSDCPLTFGDLRWGLGQRCDPNDDPGCEPDPDKHPAIKLKMITSCLTLGRPYSLPFPVQDQEKNKDETGPFLFDPVEFRQFFPERVVQWMEKHPSVEESPKDPFWNGHRLLPFPAPDELPVVVAARLSISFPILLCALPLYRVDKSLARNQENSKIPVEQRYTPPSCPASEGAQQIERDCAERCWFSDGGIAINFPFNFFDRALPRWPTFGVNVRDPHPDHPINTDPARQAENVWMPENNLQGILPPWRRFDSLFGFLQSILDTARTWMDSTQIMGPGNRDRIVHVSVAENEGGLNLTMPTQMIDDLGNRGLAAGKLLTEHYASHSSAFRTTWDNHRWVRYRSSMALVEETLQALQSSFDYSSHEVGEQSYRALIEREIDSEPKGYPFEDEEQQKYAKEATMSLLALVTHWRDLQETHGSCFNEENIPHPRPVMEIRPLV